MIHITNSERSSAACPQRWLLQYGLGLRPRTRNRALDLGTLLHKALEIAADPSATMPYMQALESIDDAEEKQLAELRLAAAEYAQGIVNPDALIAKPSDIEHAAEDARVLITRYIERWANEPLGEVILKEKVLRAPVHAPTGKSSSRTRFAGKVDKVVNLNGKLWLVEHKTTSTPLVEWVEKHRRSPQALTYAWLLAQHGFAISGVIYDLIQTKPPKSWEELEVLKSGKRLSKVAGLPWTTAEEFMKAVENVGLNSTGTPGTLDDEDWYRPTFNALLERDNSGFWFLREYVLFEQHEMERTSVELYRSATDIRRWREQVELHSSPDATPERIEDSLHAIGGQFPREAGLCWQHHRLCVYAALCGSWSRYDAEQFEVTNAHEGHSELEEK